MNLRYTYRKVWQTWETFGGAILSQLNDAGIKVEGKMVHAQLPDSIMQKFLPIQLRTAFGLSECNVQIF